MNDGQVSLNDCLQTALEAQERGVVVNWQDMTFKVYNLATNYIAQLEGQLAKANPAVVQSDDTRDHDADAVDMAS